MANSAGPTRCVGPTCLGAWAWTWLSTFVLLRSGMQPSEASLLQRRNTGPVAQAPDFICQPSKSPLTRRAASPQSPWAQLSTILRGPCCCKPATTMPTTMACCMPHPSAPPTQRLLLRAARFPLSIPWRAAAPCLSPLPQASLELPAPGATTVIRSRNPKPCPSVQQIPTRHLRPGQPHQMPRSQTKCQGAAA